MRRSCREARPTTIRNGSNAPCCPPRACRAVAKSVDNAEPGRRWDACTRSVTTKARRKDRPAIWLFSAMTPDSRPPQHHRSSVPLSTNGRGHHRPDAQRRCLAAGDGPCSEYERDDNICACQLVQVHDFSLFSSFFQSGPSTSRAEIAPAAPRSSWWYILTCIFRCGISTASGFKPEVS